MRTPTNVTTSEVLWRTLQDYNAQIGALMSRLGLLLSFNTFTLGIIATSLRRILDGVAPGRPRTATEAVLAVFVLAALVAIALVVRVLQPSVRPSPEARRSLFFFADVVLERSPDEYVGRFTAADEAALARDLATQVMTVAALLRNKYAAVRLAGTITLVFQLPAIAALAMLQLFAGSH